MDVTTNYAGIVLEELYKVWENSNDLMRKGAVRMLTGIDSDQYIPKMSSSENPLGAYESTPSGETASTTYTERKLSVAKRMLYQEFNPIADFGTIWPKFRSQGDLTNMILNPEILSAILELHGYGMGEQLATVAFQGDAINDGFLDYAAADASVLDVANVGAITTANVVDVLLKVWAEIPNKFMDDPFYRIMMSTADWKKLQMYNLTVKKSTVGVLDENIKSLLLDKRIEHFIGIPENTIMASKGTPGNDSNLFMGAWVDPEAEAPRIMRVANNSDNWFIRINMKTGFQYREGSEIVLYQGS